MPNPFDQFDQAAPTGVPAGGAPVYGAPPKADKPDPAPSGYRFKPDGSLEPIPGGPHDIGRGAPGDITKTGDDYLATLTPELAGQVRALSDGRRAFPTGSALRSPQMQELVAAASQYDPALDASNSSTRVATRKDFTSGPSAKNITAINTALGHLGTLSVAGKNLNNGSIPMLNSVENWFDTNVEGDPRTTNFDIARQAVVDELERAFRGASGSEAGIASWKNSINSAQSPAQLRAAIGQGVTLLNSRLESLNDQYQRGMGKSADPMELLSPHAQIIFSHLQASGDGVVPQAGAASSSNGSNANGGGGSPPPTIGGGGVGPSGGGPTGYGLEQRVVSNTGQAVDFTSGASATHVDDAMSNRVDAMIRQGVPLGQINQEIVAKGYQPIRAGDYAQWTKFFAAHPNYQGRSTDVFRAEDQTLGQRVANSIVSSPVAGPIAAGAINAGQVLYGNTLDNLASDPERARASLAVINAQHPTAATVGSIVGGVEASMLGEAALARLGVSGAIARGALADTAVGAANGAGAADDGGSRIAGAIGGGAAALVGNLIGRGVVGAAGKMIAPTGGTLGELYAAGVRPTIGQRAAAMGNGKGVAGTVGKAINATEEALQSVPVVGAAVRGARQEARDQFQVGAFNDALKEIGEQLPKGMGPGTDPHLYAQGAFNRVYDQARSGMTMVPDQDLRNDLNALFPDIAALGPQARQRLASIIDNRVVNRLVNGQMTGDAYKKTMAALGKQVANLRKDPGNADLADVVENVSNALDANARRHSSPAAVSLLDAADAGYAKMVRIEGAAARRGPDADGTFTPNQLSAEVQKASGGVRSRAFLRGDALMQSYANAGRALGDKLPNSGTVDRAAALGLAGVGATVHPGSTAVMAALGALYAPGVRRVMQAATAPRGAKAAQIAAQLAKINRLASATGAATGTSLATQ